MSGSNDQPPTDGRPVPSHNNDYVNLRVTYLHAGNPRPPHDIGAILSTTTIGDLRNRLQAELLEHPRPEEQRLIYQGRPLMHNNDTLREALRLEGPTGPLPFTIHIIIQPRRVSAHFRPDQAPQMAQPPQPSNSIPPVNPPGPQNQPMDPRIAMEQAQRMQAMAQAQLNMLQQQFAPFGQMPQNFSATVQIHGQPMGAPQNMTPNTQTAPPNVLQHLASEAGRLAAMTPRLQDRPSNPPAYVQAGPQGANPPPTNNLTPHRPLNMPPFQRPSSAPGHPEQRSTASEAHPNTQGLPTFLSPNPVGLPVGSRFSHLPQPFSLTQPFARSSGQPTVWLASSRNGPEALLFAPGHGFFTSQTPAPTTIPAPTPTTQLTESAPQNQPQEGRPDVNAGQGQVAIRQPGNHARPRRPREAAQENDMWGLVLQRGWLFLRLYLFMFVLSEPGTWRRYALLAVAVMICLLPQENPLNNAFGAARRHIDNLIGPPHPQPGDRERRRARREQRRAQRLRQGPVPATGQAQETPAHQNQAAPENTPQVQPPSPSNVTSPRTRGAVNTTPQETAQRSVREHERRNPNVLRDMFYWVEQAVALFLASLVPGVGERHVAAREEARREEERERLEAQAAREAEEKKRKEEMEQSEMEREQGLESMGEKGEASGESDLLEGTASSSILGEASGSAVVDEGGSSAIQTGNEDQEGAVRARFT